MRWVSNAFNQEIASGNRNYLCKAVITLADNETVLTLTNEDILIGGFEIEDAAASDSDFDALGSVIINSASLSLPNKNSEYSTLVFDNAEVELYVGLNISGTETYMRMGTYIVDDANYTYTNINLHLLDYMQKFDVPYNITPTFPTTLGDIVIDLCDQCAMEYDPNILTDFEGFEHELAGITFDTSVTTCRDVLHWIGQIVGCFFKCDSFGVLVARWFDRELLESEDTTDINLHEINSLYSQDIAVDDTVITGVKIIIKSYDGESAYEEYLEGSEGYVITIEDNALIYESDVDAIKSRLGEQLIGLTFRRARIEHVNDPSIESGDVAILTDRDGNTHPILITSTDFRPEASQTTVCSSQTVGMNSSAKYKQAVKEYAETNARIKTATISSIVVNYRISPSGTDPSAGTESWGDTIPTIPEGMYLWTRTQITYNNGTVSTAYSVSRNGESVDNLHFFWDNTGAHVTIGERTADLGRNVLITNNGFYVREGTTTIASFTDTGSRIGTDDTSHLELDYHSLKFIDNAFHPYFHVSDLQDEDGYVTEIIFGDGTTTLFNLPLYIDTLKEVTIDGVVTTAYTIIDHTTYNSIRFTTAPALYAEIHIVFIPHDYSYTKAFTFGSRNNGSYLNIIGWLSTVFGEANIASGLGAMAVGGNTLAAGRYSYAEGAATSAYGVASHAQNSGTIARWDSQTAIGKYNVEDTNDIYAFIIGNGAYGEPSNAFGVTWYGDMHFACESSSYIIDANLYAAIVALGWQNDVTV